MRYDQLSKEALVNEYNKVQEEYQSLNRLGLKLNLSRGKPDSDQLRLSHKMLHTLDDEDYGGTAFFH